jgi:uncharacterized damage-inducible protein DinB
MERPEIIAELRAVPDRLAEICAGLSDGQMRMRPAEGEWSLLEVACHLRDAATEEGMRVRLMVEEDNPTLVPYDQEERAAERRYQEDDPARVLAAARAYWSGLAYQLEHLPDAGWQRPAIHPELGPMTVQSRVERQVPHARAHLDQMRATRNTVAPPATP